MLLKRAARSSTCCSNSPDSRARAARSAADSPRSVGCPTLPVTWRSRRRDCQHETVAVVVSPKKCVAVAGGMSPQPQRCCHLPDRRIIVPGPVHSGVPYLRAHMPGRHRCSPPSAPPSPNTPLTAPLDAFVSSDPATVPTRSSLLTRSPGPVPTDALSGPRVSACPPLRTRFLFRFVNFDQRHSSNTIVVVYQRVYQCPY